MIGVIVAGHGNFASEIASVAESIMGEQEYLETVNLKAGEGEYTLRNKLNEILGMMEIDDVVVLSDIFGGSITNMCMYFAKNQSHVAVITGVNLPMVLKVLAYRNTKMLKELVALACEGGRDGIVDACGLLDEKSGEHAVL